MDIPENIPIATGNNMDNTSRNLKPPLRNVESVVIVDESGNKDNGDTGKTIKSKYDSRWGDRKKRSINGDANVRKKNKRSSGVIRVPHNFMC